MADACPSKPMMEALLACVNLWASLACQNIIQKAEKSGIFDSHGIKKPCKLVIYKARTVRGMRFSSCCAPSHYK